MQAIEYIHASDIKVHGTLNTSTCLVTQQWMLRVSSFGLNHVLDHLQRRNDIELALPTIDGKF